MNRTDLSAIRLSKLQIKDAAAVRAAGLIEGSRSFVEEKIRKMTEGDCRYYLYSDKEDPDTTAIVGLIPSGFGNSFYIDIRMVSDDIRTFTICLSDILKTAFLKRQVHKVCIVIGVFDIAKESVLKEFGFLQEAVLHEEIFNGSSYEDAALFYMTAALFKEYNVCFVPFVKGILAVYGGQQYIDRIEFLNYGKEPSSFLVRERAMYYGLLDESGRFLPRGSDAYEFSADEIDEMPFELSRAYTELKEYFLKKRFVFDLNLQVAEGTPFQRKVWDALKTIPYGATLSYEDIALMLTDNDIKEARKLSRAVGNACAENPLPIVVPCHRVIGKNGMLMGFSGGIEFKDYLLQNEMFPGVLQLG